MTNALGQTRQDVKDVLVAAGLNAFDSVPDRITPPVVVVRPDDPYVQDGETFTNYLVRLIVTVLVNPSTNAVWLENLDDAICTVITALKLDQWSINVGVPYVEVNGTAEYPAVDINITNWIEI